MIDEAATTVSVEAAGALLGVSRTTAYRLAACGEFPVPVLRVGRQLRVPTALLADALGLRPDEVVERADATAKKRAQSHVGDSGKGVVCVSVADRTTERGR